MSRAPDFRMRPTWPMRHGARVRKPVRGKRGAFKRQTPKRIGPAGGGAKLRRKVGGFYTNPVFVQPSSPTLRLGAAPAGCSEATRSITERRETASRPAESFAMRTVPRGSALRPAGSARPSLGREHLHQRVLHPPTRLDLRLVGSDELLRNRLRIAVGQRLVETRAAPR